MLNMTMDTDAGTQRHQVRDLEHASRVYSAARDESGEGASTWGPATLTDDTGQHVGHVSYNGKVWATRDDGAALLFNPYAVEASPDTPEGVLQVRPQPEYTYQAPQAVRTFDTFEVSTTDGGQGVVRVYAGTGTAADSDGAAFDFLDGVLIRWGARVTPETMAGIRACLAAHGGAQ